VSQMCACCSHRRHPCPRPRLPPPRFACDNPIPTVFGVLPVVLLLGAICCARVSAGPAYQPSRHALAACIQHYGQLWRQRPSATCQIPSASRKCRWSTRAPVATTLPRRGSHAQSQSKLTRSARPRLPPAACWPLTAVGLGTVNRVWGLAMQLCEASNPPSARSS
jgi:hypothetical protein